MKKKKQVCKFVKVMFLIMVLVMGTVGLQNMNIVKANTAYTLKANITLNTINSANLRSAVVYYNDNPNIAFDSSNPVASYQKLTANVSGKTLTLNTTIATQVPYIIVIATDTNNIQYFAGFAPKWDGSKWNCGGGTQHYPPDMATGGTEITIGYLASHFLPNIIQLKDLNIGNISSSYSYTGSAIVPKPSISLRSDSIFNSTGNNILLGENTNYTISYSNNVNVGLGKMQISFNKPYSGTVESQFRIVAKSISEAAINATLDKTAYGYTGSAVSPIPTVIVEGKTLTKDKDYTITYGELTKIGSGYKAKVTLQGNYSGTKEVTYSIIDTTVAFMNNYLGGESAPYTKVTTTNYQQIINGESTYNTMTDGQKKLINDRLTDTTYPELLAEAKLMKVKQDALNNIDTNANTQKAAINALSYLTKAEKDKYIADIDQAIATAKNQISNADNTSDVDSIKTNLTNSINKTKETAILQNEKNKVISEIDLDVKKKTEEINALNNLSASEKKSFINQINAASTTAKQAVEDASSSAAIVTAKNAYDSSSQKTKEAAQLQNAKNKANENILQYAKTKKDEIAKLDLSDTQKTKLNKEIDQVVGKAKDAITQSNSISDVETLEKNAKTSIDNEKNQAIGEEFANKYIRKEKDGPIYKETTSQNVDQILNGKEPWKDLTVQQQAIVDQIIKDGYNFTTYQDYLDNADKYLDQYSTKFIKNHMTQDNDIITEVKLSTLDNILGGEKEFGELSQSEKNAINKKLKTAGATQTYEEMLTDAHMLAKENASTFVKDYLTVDNQVVTEVNQKTLDAILSAESEYSTLTQSEKDEVNAKLKASGSTQTYEEMLAEAKVMLTETTNHFIENHMTQNNEIITKVKISTLDNIIGGEDDFNALTYAQKAEINAKLKTAGATQTYEEMLADAHMLAKENASTFVKDYLTVDNQVVTEVNQKTLDAILSAESEYSTLTQSEKDEVNAKLKASGSTQTYEEMLAKAKAMLEGTADGFLKIHMTDSRNELITVVTRENLDKIINGEMDFNALTAAQKNKVNAELKAAGATQTYEEMLATAKKMVQQNANDFIDKYVSDRSRNIYKTANQSNYAQILSGQEVWNQLSESEKNAINELLIHSGGKTYEELLKQANEIKKSVKTDDDTDMMPLYMLLSSSLVLGGYIYIKRKQTI